MMTRSRLTPISVAVAGSCATARMPRPSRLRFTNWSAMTNIAIDARMMMSCRFVTGAPKIVNTGAGGSSRIVPSGFEPRQMRMTCWMANDAPIAVMRNARRGALRRRSGR